jgi:dihydrofolate synthase / folylpolyglutamate synthase
VEVAKQQRASREGIGSSAPNPSGATAADRGYSLPPDDAEPDPAYRALLQWIWSFSERWRTPDELAAQRAAKLDRMRALLAALGNPERSFSALLVAGTKGKGSTVAMLEACLREGGLHTGRYTSPHLVNWRERTCVDGQPISIEAVLALQAPMGRAVEDLPASLGHPTTFEVGTAIAFQYFATRAIDIAVVETGVGGRFDATNVLDPLVSAITPISYDHTQTLGETLSEIAWHKAGILRSRRRGVLAPQLDEARLTVEREAVALAAPLEEVGREWRWSEVGTSIRIESTHSEFEPLETRVGLLGDHQRDNAATAIATLYVLGKVAARLGVGRSAQQRGLANVDWPGRLQVLSERPWVVVDGAHNAASAEALRAAVDRTFHFDRLILVLGLTEGKDARGVLAALAPRASAVCLTRSRHERSAPTEELDPLVRAVAPRARIVSYPAFDAAIEGAVSWSTVNDLVLITGSLFLVGEALVWWRRSRQ